MNIEAILTGCVVHKGKDIAICAMQAAGGGGKTSFHVLLGADWFDYEQEPEWAAVGMAGVQYLGAIEPVVIAAAADGRTWELSPSSKVERMSRIADGHCGVTRLVAMSEAVWACGMGRLVMQREPGGQWLDVSAPRGTLAEGITGFTGMAELAPDTQIAVGWRGEIWIRSARGWVRQDSPSNSNFNAVSVGASGEAVVVGDHGGLVSGRAGHWKALDTRTDFNLQGVCHFGDETFVCSDFEIFRLVEGGLLRETRFKGEQRPATCMNFMVGKDGVFCQGERDLYRFESGQWDSVL